MKNSDIWIPFSLILSASSFLQLLLFRNRLCPIPDLCQRYSGPLRRTALSASGHSHKNALQPLVRVRLLPET